MDSGFSYNPIATIFPRRPLRYLSADIPTVYDKLRGTRGTLMDLGRNEGFNVQG